MPQGQLEIHFLSDILQQYGIGRDISQLFDLTLRPYNPDEQRVGLNSTNPNMSLGHFQLQFRPHRNFALHSVI